MTNQYVFEPVFCNPASGWEKGQVEKNVQDSRPRLWQPTPSFPDLAALNAWLEPRRVELWRDIPHGTQPGTIAGVWAEEQATLIPLPTTFDGFVEQTKRVSRTSLIGFDRNRYSVPASFANRPVSLRSYPEWIVVATDGKVLCEHARVIQRGHHLLSRTIYDWRHYLAAIQRKPGALRNGAPFVEFPKTFRQLQDQMLRKPGGGRELVDILALALRHEPKANIVRYDGLRGGCGMTEEDRKAKLEAYDRDLATAERVLFDIRSGGEVAIMHDPMSGWEMSGDGLSCIMPLETSARAVNLVLGRLARHYRQLSALLGNPDLHDTMQLGPM